MADTPLKPVGGLPKKIIVCCDGTWQSSVSGKHNLPSNITRIARTIAKAGIEDGTTWQQIVFYDAGVGTGSLSWLESGRQGATGDGLVANVIEGYNFVVNNYSPGDKIYCFGFSRGAFTARAIAGMITDFGVIKPSQMRHFASLFAAYKTNTSKYTFRKTKEYFEWFAGKAPLVPESHKETVYPKIPWYDTAKGSIEWEGSRSIEVVGIFDTVGSLGVADTYLHSHASSRQQYEWLNVKWNPYIKHAFHALALDDRRQPFLPTLYYIPNDDVIEEEKKAMKKDEEDWPELTEHRAEVDRELEELRKTRKPDLVQVWFTGVHINVGGGTDDAKTDLEGLANITFAWMVEQCKPYIAFEDFTNATIAGYVNEMITDVDEQTKGTWQDAPSTVNKAIGAVAGAVTGAVGSAGRWVGSLFAGADDNAASKEKLVRSYCYSVIANPPYEPKHWALFRPQDSYTLMYKAMSFPATRTPGACDDRSAEPYKPLTDLGQTNEYIHPSVQWRLEQSRINDEKEYRYKSEALKGFVYTEKDGVAGWAKGKLWIQEWAMKGALQDEDPTKFSENAEMALIDQCLDKVEVRKFLKSHTVAWQKTQKSQSKPKK